MCVSVCMYNVYLCVCMYVCAVSLYERIESSFLL